jgi:excinuclease UvrABC ATPase subunit
MSQQPCATCKGMRLKPEALAVRLHMLSSIGVEAPHELHTARASLG